MKDQDLAMMSARDLWALYEKIRAILPTKLDAEKHQLERRLVQLEGRIEHKPRARRPYPKVHPKYRNPETPSETWSGRGKQPHWVGAQLRSGKKVDELLISQAHWTGSADYRRRLKEFRGLLDFPSPRSLDSAFFTRSRSLTNSAYLTRSSVSRLSAGALGLPGFIQLRLTPLCDTATKLAR
jgi:DNA-binding protein H-NS